MLGIVLPTSYIILEALLEGDRNGSKRSKQAEADDNDIRIMPIRNDDSSIAKDSVFDWGPAFIRRLSDGGSSVTSAPSLPQAAEMKDSAPSRYDPKAMSRIVDITDLVDDSNEDSDSDFEDIGALPPYPGGIAPAPKKKGKKPRYGFPQAGRRALALTAIAAVIVGGAAIVGYAILRPEGNEDLLRPTQMGEGREGARQQMLLEAAERVAFACDMTGKGDLGRCRELCEEKECCFDKEESCEDDEGAHCAAYAGCLALREGEPYDAAEEEEERKDRG